MRNPAVLNRQFSKSFAESFPARVLRIVVLRVHDDHVAVAAAGEQRSRVLFDEVHDGRQRDEEVLLPAETVEELSVGVHHAGPVRFGEGPVMELEVGVVFGVQNAAVVGIDDEFAAAEGVEGAFDEEVGEGFGVGG